MRQNNTVWYQINPSYFQQIVEQKQLMANPQGLKFFRLVKECLPYIKELGCKGVWLMPIYIKGSLNRKGSGSPYSVKEYQIDPHYGSEDDLKKLINEAHRLDLQIIGEYVPNHLAPDAPFLANNAEDLVYRNQQNKPFHNQDWTDTVKLNHSHHAIVGFTSANLLWLSKFYGFDGFRLDMAHYPLHTTTIGVASGKGDPEFWSKILSNKALKEKTWIAEVYDDLTQEFNGYKDHFELVKEGMIAYDKKTHDVLARKLRLNPPHQVTQEKLFVELYNQAQVSHLAGIDVKKGFFPFLRIPSNHDDCPGIKIFNGIKEYITAFQVLAFLPGHLMLYSGEEFGLKIKPSITGINQCDELGNMLESNQIRFVSYEEQNEINSEIKETLRIRSSEAVFNIGATLVVNVHTKDLSPSCDIVAYARYSAELQEIIIVAANLSNSPDKAWGQIKNFYPTFDYPTYEFNWLELLEWINPQAAKKGYKIQNLASGETLAKIKPNEEFWVGLGAYEVQVLKILPL
ncbi:MAG: alpha-amylase family glycosyl hydrolase [Candidatus Caenarcaniphilales bacterium]|nr:alpha-amylase family glycosyl hydrolase [Candidatus Caenarcaniphilales bacterium]